MAFKRIRFALCVILMTELLVTGCTPLRTAHPVPAGRELQWPALPLEPKIRWVKEIRNYRDIGLQQGFWKRVWGWIAGDSTTDIIKPYGIYCDDRQRLFVVDVGAGTVHQFDIGSGRYSVIEGKDGNRFNNPIGITGDDNGKIYITDSGDGIIYQYSVSDEKLCQLSPFRLQRPTGIAYNKVNRLLYVSDTGTHQVIAIDLEGKERFRFGGRGSASGQFNFPTDLTVDAYGRVIVTDALNARIQIFSPEGHPMSSFGKPGDTAGNFSKPKGVAVDSDGHIYVCDALFDAVQIFDDSGKLLLYFGESGERPAQLWMPSGIFIDGSDNIYVADTYNRRVQVFRYLK